MDLVLEDSKNEVWAIEVKRFSAPQVSKGFYYACDDIKATRKFVIYPGEEQYPLANEIEVMGLIAFLQLLVD